MRQIAWIALAVLLGIGRVSAASCADSTGASKPSSDRSTAPRTISTDSGRWEEPEYRAEHQKAAAVRRDAAWAEKMAAWASDLIRTMERLEVASSVYGELAFSKNTAAREEAIRELSVPIEELRACGKTLMRDVGAPPAGSSMRVAYRAVRNACAEYERAGDALGRHFDAQREHVREFQRGRAVKRLYRGHDQMEAARLTLETAADQ